MRSPTGRRAPSGQDPDGDGSRTRWPRSRRVEAPPSHPAAVPRARHRQAARECRKRCEEREELVEEVPSSAPSLAFRLRSTARERLVRSSSRGKPRAPRRQAPVVAQGAVPHYTPQSMPPRNGPRKRAILPAATPLRAGRGQDAMRRDSWLLPAPTRPASTVEIARALSAVHSSETDRAPRRAIWGDSTDLARTFPARHRNRPFRW
jgi:hypothetical protein